MGVFARMMKGLASEGGDQKTIMIARPTSRRPARLRACGQKKGGATISTGV